MLTFTSNRNKQIGSSLKIKETQSEELVCGNVSNLILEIQIKTSICLSLGQVILSFAWSKTIPCNSKAINLQCSLQVCFLKLTDAKILADCLLNQGVSAMKKLINLFLIYK